MKAHNSRYGFISTEVLVVVSILAVFSSMTAVTVGLVSSRTRRAHLIAVLREVQMASDLYYSEAGRFPVSDTPTTWPKPIAFNSSHNGAAFVPIYLRREPPHRALPYGFDRDSNEVTFGVTSTGRVFASQAVPEDWGDPSVLVYTVDSLRGPTTLSLLGPEIVTPAQGPVVEAASIELSLSSVEAPAGSEVLVSVTVLTASSAPASGVQVVITMSGCLSGARSETLTTGAAGTCGLSYTGTQPELVTITASAIRPSALRDGQARDRLAYLHPPLFQALDI